MLEYSDTPIGLARLQAGFLTRLHHHLEEIEGVLPQGDQPVSLPLDVLLGLSRTARQLMTSATAFGFMALVERAKRFEMDLDQAVEEADRGEVRRETFAQVTASARDVAQASREVLEQPFPSLAPALDGKHSEEAPATTLLLVAEEEEGISSLATQLEHLSYRVQRVLSLRHVLQAEKEHQPSAILIVSDFAKSHLNVLETYVALREKRGEGAPILYLSNRNDFDARLHAVRLDGEAFLTSSASPMEIVSELSHLVTQPSASFYHVLLILRDRLTAARYSVALERAGITATVIDDPEQAFKILGERAIDLVLADFDMGRCNGFELAALLRQMDRYAGLPMLFLSDTALPSSGSGQTPLGSDEFLVRPVGPDRLVSVVSERAKRASALRRFIDFDEATGLMNPARFAHEMSVQLARARRQHGAFTYALIDLDHFSLIGDTYGHASGDLVIKTLAHLLRQRLRETDSIGRLGGKQFGIVLPETGAEQAFFVLSEVHAKFSTIPFNAQGREFSLSFSGGIASYPDFLQEGAISEAAGKALRQAKRLGRNRLIMAG